MGIIKEKNNLHDMGMKLDYPETSGFFKRFMLVLPIVVISLYVGVVNYNLFHLIIELVGIFVVIGVAVAVYKSSNLFTNGLYMYLAAMFLSWSIFQIMHLLSYKGINILPWNNYDLSVQISMAAKYLEVLSLLIMVIVPLRLANKKNIKLIAVLFFLSTGFLILSILQFRIFPQCVYEDAVPTTFKMASEYIILSLYIFILLSVCVRKTEFVNKMFNSIFSFLALKLLSEVLFISCSQVNDVATALAHMLRLFAFLIAYRVISSNVKREPYTEGIKEVDVSDRGLNQNKVQLQVTNSLLTNVNSLLETAKIGLGYDKLRLENHNIVRVVEKVTTSVSDNTSNKRIAFLFDTDQEEIITACDIDKIEWILLKLLSNSIRFSKEGGQVEVNVHQLRDNVLISVLDTGVYMPERLGDTFNSCEQYGDLLNQEYDVTGNGLSLVRTLVEAHGGNIRVERNLGIGSKYLVTLPIKVLKGKEFFSDMETEDRINKDIVEKIRAEFSGI